MFLYNQKTGELKNNAGKIIGVGYSGHGEGVNNPALQSVHDIGPLPCGDYTIELVKDSDGNPIDWNGKKAPVFRLVPKQGTNVFGRTNFEMHGDDVKHPGMKLGSLGCMIQGRDTRVQVMISTDKDLRVF